MYVSNKGFFNKSARFKLRVSEKPFIKCSWLLQDMQKSISKSERCFRNNIQLSTLYAVVPIGLL